MCFIEDDYPPYITYSTVTHSLLEGENSKLELKSCIEKNIKPSKNYSTLTPSVLEGEVSKVNNKENTKPSKTHSTDTDLARLRG